MRKTTKKSFLKTLISLGLTLGTSATFSLVQAEEAPSYDFDSVIVTATRVEKSVKDVPASVTIITASDIEKMNIKSVDQALVKSAGIYIARLRGMGQSTPTVTMRGISSQSQVLIMLDGQSLNDGYSGVVNWSDIPIDSVERIEIVKGVGSSLYGSSAMGGVINIITKNPEKRELKVSSAWGSENSWVNRLDIRDKLSDKFSYSVTYEKRTTDGYPSNMTVVSPQNITSSTLLTNGVTGWTPTTDNKGNVSYLVGDQGKSTWDEHDIHSKLQYKIDKDRTLTFGVTHHKDRYGYDYSPYNSYLRLNGNPFDSGKIDVGGGKYIAVNPTSFINTSGGREEYVYTLGYKDTEEKLSFNAGLTKVSDTWNVGSSSIKSVTSGTGDLSEFPSKRLNLNIQKELQLGQNDTALIGFQYTNDWMHKKVIQLTNWQDRNTKKTLKSQAEANSRNFAIFAQDEHKINDKLSLTGSLRYDTWKTYDSTVQFDATHMEKYSPREDSAVSPKLALQYALDQDSSVYVSWGKAFGIPPLYQMFSGSISGSATTPYSSRSYTEPNPDLKPQKISTIETGWKSKVNEKTTVAVTYFHNEIKDLIYGRTSGLADKIIDGIAYKTQRSENAGEGKTDGVELEVSHKISPMWSSFFNYTYQRPVISKCGTNKAIEGKLVRFVPQQIFNVGIDYQSGKWSGELLGRFQTKQYSTDGNTDTADGVYGVYDKNFVANLNIGYKFTKDDSVELKIDNLFGKEYYNYYLAPGRTYMLQVKHSF